MNALNQLILEGNVVRDSTVKETSRGTKFCTMQLANNRVFKDSKGDFQKEVNYFEIQAWGQNFSDIVVKHGTKGRGVRVVGRIKQDRWKSEDGKNHEKIFIIADHIEFKPSSNSKESPIKVSNPENEATEEDDSFLEDAKASTF